MKELERTLALVDSLEGEDWSQPTACTLWDVRDMVSHMAGTSAQHASWAEFRRQNIQNPYMREAEQPVDGINKRQVEDRAEAAPEELVAELRTTGPKAIRTRQRLPWLVRQVRIPQRPPVGLAPIEYLTDLIYTRDMWMHRLDICQTTGRQMVMTAEHDGRVMALVLRDLARKMRDQLRDRSVVLDLTGKAGGAYQFGRGTAEATIELDLISFNELASGRITPAEATSRALVRGSKKVADWFLSNAEVLY